MIAKPSGRLLAACCALLSAFFCLSAGAQAPDWPNRPVRFVVPFPPGGTVDPLARLLSSRLTPALGQQFIVDNRPGGSGSIGAGIAAKAPPDGYTYLFVFDTHAVNPFLIPNLPYDTAKDLAPVMLVGTSPMAIVTNNAKPYKTFADVIRAAKAKPGTVTYGTVGAGSLGHLTMTLLEQAGGFKLIHVPYKGGGPMTVDVLGGQVDLGIGSVALLAPQVRGGKMRAIAVTGDKRTNVMPETPALAEQAFPGFSALAWWGIFAPAGTQKAALDKFHGELVKALNLPEVRKQLTEQMGMDLVVSDPATLQRFLLAQMERWGKVVREHNIRAE
ncbi:MAG TPA: tripartite tricarboxylate transporter substrate binding protein [Burkholderiales bacterium]|nr:tripartite tricarboxylate transporter substrate binding protein [Burkholderiales bacterium]